MLAWFQQILHQHEWYIEHLVWAMHRNIMQKHHGNLKDNLKFELRVSNIC
jgi:hypothetical protein